MLKVLVACGCGMGSSQMIKKNCSTVLKSMGIEHTIHHTSIDEAKTTANNYDLVVVGTNCEKLLKAYDEEKADKMLLLGDILMGIVDPRISFSKKEGAR